MTRPLPFPVHRLSHLTHDLSQEAQRRLKWMDFYASHGGNARRTCRHFDISPTTFYRWWHRYDPQRLATLESRSHRPRRVRQPQWSPALAAAVLRLREEYPRWGKDKLVVLLHREGIPCSTSTVGRILSHLKGRGLLREPLLLPLRRRHRPLARPYATRKPRDYVPQAPGDLVQLDTLELRPLPGVVYKQFTARDVVSRWDVLEAHTRATAHLAAGFLDAVQARMPFPVRAVQVDGGSEFMATFEEECQRRGLRLFVLPPHSPKLNGRVERAHRTHAEEFYQVVDLPDTLGALNRALRGWERVYNTVRPHQALGYRTPLEYLLCHYPDRRKEVVSTIT